MVDHLSVQAGTQIDPPPAHFNMAAYVLGHADKTPDKTALSILHGDHTDDLSYADLSRAIRGIATGLLARGVPAGGRVLMRLGNGVEFPLAYLACIAAGLVPIPTSAQLTAPEITKMAAEITPDLVIAGPDIALPDQAIMTLSSRDMMAMRSLPPAAFAMGDPNRLAYIIYTSGTSGQPRAVMHAHRAIWARRMMYDGWYGLRAQDRLLHAGAFNWTYTLGTGLMDPWAMGATALIPAPNTASSALPALLARHRASLFAAAPGVYRQALRAPIPDLPDLRHGLSAGEKLPAALSAEWQAATGTQIFEAFGMSECSTFISGAPNRVAPAGTLGYAQSGRTIAVLGADGAPVPRGTAGVLGVHRDDCGLMLGYFGQADETASRYAGDYFMTGDQVSMAEDGAITYLGRDDDMMNAGGFRVSPLEVESAMIRHSAITECAAVELTVKANTTAICLYYTADAPLAEADLAAFAAQSLARYKQPRRFIHIASLPKNANGKILRKGLRTATS